MWQSCPRHKVCPSLFTHNPSQVQASQAAVRDTTIEGQSWGCQEVHRASALMHQHSAREHICPCRQRLLLSCLLRTCSKDHPGHDLRHPGEQAIGSGEGDVAFQARLKQAEADSALLQELLQKGAASHKVRSTAQQASQVQSADCGAVEGRRQQACQSQLPHGLACDKLKSGGKAGPE